MLYYLFFHCLFYFFYFISILFDVLFTVCMYVYYYIKTVFLATCNIHQFRDLICPEKLSFSYNGIITSDGQQCNFKY